MVCLFSIKHDLALFLVCCTFLFVLPDDIRTTLLLNVVDKTEPDKSLDIYKATIFESRLDSSIFYQKPVDEVILVNASDMKRPSTSSLSSSPSDLGCPQKKRLRTKKRVVIGKTHNKLEEAICNEAEIQQQNGDEKEETEAEAEAKLQPLLTHNSRQDTLLMLH